MNPLIQSTVDLRSGLFFPLEGRVESIDDPKGLGRVQVRVWALHGLPEDTPQKGLPWAIVNQPGGCGYDHGPSHGYQVGQDVIVLHRMGDPRFPVVIGSFHGDSASEIEMLTRNGEPKEQPTWTAPKGNTVPQDVFDGNETKHPTRAVWQKSYKGHTILVEDRDGEEFLQVIDRAGQTIEMFCPVTEEGNENNAEQRGARSSAKGDQVGHDKMVDRNAYIRLTDLSGQTITMNAQSGNEEIVLLSQPRAGSRQQKIVLSSAVGRDKVSIEDTMGNQVTLDAFGDNALSLSSYTGSGITLKKNGDVQVNSEGNYSVAVKGDLVESYNGDQTREFMGQLKERAMSNRFMTIMGSFVASAMNGWTQVVGGAIDVIASNASTDGVKSEAISFTAVVGNILQKAVAGSVTLANLISRVEVGVDGSVTLQVGPGTGLGSIKINPAGFISINTLQPGVIPCNNLPACLYTGAPHGTNPKVLVPGPGV